MNKKLLFILLSFAVVITGCEATETTNSSSFKPEISTKIDSTTIANPWGETQSLTVAADSSEVDFTPPSEEALPDDVELTTYRYMEGTVEALYSQTENKMVIRKSYSVEGKELSGDYNKYSQNWDESIDNISVHCCGDKETINNACYDIDNAHYSILYNPGKEGDGLSKDQLKELMLAIK